MAVESTPQLHGLTVLGLQIMQERAERIGAELSIGDRDGGGTRTKTNT